MLHVASCPGFGAEVVGPLPLPFDAEICSELRQLVSQFGVVVLRGQPFSAEDQLAFARSFGDLIPASTRVGADGSGLEFVVHKASGQGGSAETFHCDGILEKDGPYGFGVLRPIELPKCGGDTRFCSMRLVLNSLSPSFVDFLGGLSCRYSLLRPVADRSYLRVGSSNGVLDWPFLVRGSDGGPSLVFNPMSACDVPELSIVEAEYVLEFLRSRVEDSRFQLRLKWTKDSVFIFDNRAVLHSVIIDYLPETRRLARVFVKGSPLEALSQPRWPKVPVEIFSSPRKSPSAPSDNKAMALASP